MADPRLTHNDMLTIIKSYVDQRGLTTHNTESYDELVRGGITEILESLFKLGRIINNDRKLTDEDRKIKNYYIQGSFNNARIGSPQCSAYITGQQENLFPHRSRITGLPYSSMITMGASFKISANYVNGKVDEKVIEVPSFQVGEFPTMVRGINCHTRNCPRSSLLNIGEDPMEEGGYFIAKRGEYAIDMNESLTYNTPHFHLNVKANEHVRAEILSRPNSAFENSSHVVVTYHKNNDQISVEINSTKFKNVKMPFYIIYRLLGMTSDKDIMNTIVSDHTDKTPRTKLLSEIIELAFQKSDATFEPHMYLLNRSKLISFVASKISKFVSGANIDAESESAVQYRNDDLMGSGENAGSIDEVFLQHLGRTPASRHKKLLFLGNLIQKMLLVHFKVLPPSDRDSQRDKRVHGAGISLSKVLKTQVNNGVVKPIMKALQRELKNNSWSSITVASFIDLIKNSINSTDISRAFEQSITSTSTTSAVKAKVSAQALERKNSTNTVSTLRTISVPNSNIANKSKQTERADMMRRVHSTSIGYICISQSAESGEKVGMKKQLAITATVCNAGNAIPLRHMLVNDPDIVAIEDISTQQIYHESLARVYINGEPIGICKDAYIFAKKYIDYRRKGKIDPFTTIYRDLIINEVEFWLDVGRLCRPLMIVHNNIEEYDEDRRSGKKSITFDQWINLRKEHIMNLNSGKIEFDQLIKDGVMEYITPDEQMNCLIATSIDDLNRDRHNVCIQYTHCDIPQALFGIIALIPPYANHTLSSRIAMSTCHCKQACGWYAFSHQYRFEMNRFMQFYCDVPMVKTISTSFLPANGANAMVAIMIYGGNNQEDSAIICKASAERGLYAGSFFKYAIVKLEKGEIFMTPDPLTTANIQSDSNFEKLQDGFIQVGSVVEYGDVLVGKVATNLKKDAAQKYVDKSEVYKLKETATVIDIIKTRGPDAELFVLIKYRYDRLIDNGDKLSSRFGNKCIVAELLSQSDMPYDENGHTPDIIMNPHSFPKRMAVGQIIEEAVSIIGAKRGVIHDGTAFMPVDHDNIAAELKKYGFQNKGCSRLYNGKTGDHIDCAIFMGPTFMMRMLKFVRDDEQSVGHIGPTYPETGQPIGGKHVHGGLKIDEMQCWVINSHGSMINLDEKLSYNSDGRTAYICRECGKYAAYNEFMNISVCKTCGDHAKIFAIKTTKSAMKFQEHLAAACMPIEFGLEPYEYEKFD